MNLENHKLPTIQSDLEEWYKEIPKEMTKFFGRNCFWLPWKFTEYQIMRAWHIAQKEDDHDFTHLIANIRKS